MKNLLTIFAMVFALVAVPVTMTVAHSQPNKMVMLNLNTAYAQDQAQPASAAPASAPVIQAPKVLDGFLAALGSLSPAIMGVVLMALEFLLRAMKSKNPLSLLIPVNYFCKGLAAILGFLSASVLAPLINKFQNSDQKL